MKQRVEKLRGNSNFTKLWIGQSISMFGAQITFFAFPLVAAMSLQASSMELGIMMAAQFLPSLLFGLIAGVWVDQWPKRPILIWTNLGRVLVLVFIPILYYSDTLMVWHLYLFGFALGAFTLFFDVAYMSYLPTVVPREQLIEGNSKFEMSSSVAAIGGPSLAGAMVDLLTAPFAMVAEAFSLLVSAFFVWKLPADQKSVRNISGGKRVWSEIQEGLKMVFDQDVLRTLILSSGFINLCTTIYMPVYILYLTKELGVSVATFGFITALGGGGSLFGAVVARRVSIKIGIGRTIQVTVFVTAVSLAMVAIPKGISSLDILIFMFAAFLSSFASTVRNVQQISLRLGITPSHLQGRVNATFRFVIFGMIPAGSFLGGAMGGWIGPRLTLVLAGAGAFIVFVFLFLSHLGSVHDLESEANKTVSG